MNVGDVEILRGVRRILVRHWLDLGQLSVRCVNGVVYIRGRLQRLPGYADELTTLGVGGIIAEIEGVRGVRRAQYDFQNWTFMNGAWQSLDRRQAKGRPGAPAGEPAAAAWNIESDTEPPA